MSNDPTTSPARWAPSPKLLLLVVALLVAGAVAAVLSVANAPAVGVNPRVNIGTQVPPDRLGAREFVVPSPDFYDFVEEMDEHQDSVHDLE